MNFNPRAPCGARLCNQILHTISTKISIRAPRAGRDYTVAQEVLEMHRFQSARPVRGATHLLQGNKIIIRFQSARPVRGATGFSHSSMS